MNVGEKLIKLRKERNISQEKLSEMIGVTRQTLSNWESNITSPNLQDTEKICKIFTISIDELVGNEKLIRRNKLGTKKIIFIILMPILLIIGIIGFTKRDFTSYYQTEFDCVLDGKSINISVYQEDNVYFLKVGSEEYQIGSSFNDILPSVNNVKKMLIKEGAVCK